MKIVPINYFKNNALEVAPFLIGKYLTRKFDDNSILKYKITETEAYCGEQDKACHASKGRTPRTEVMYMDGGTIYVYFVYGMHWMFNIVTGKVNEPEAVLIRGVEEFNGPAKLTKAMQINKSFNSLKLGIKNNLWIEDGEDNVKYTTSKRIGIAYAGKEWIEKPWRFVIKK